MLWCTFEETATVTVSANLYDEFGKIATENFGWNSKGFQNNSLVGTEVVGYCKGPY